MLDVSNVISPNSGISYNINEAVEFQDDATESGLCYDSVKERIELETIRKD